MKAILAIDASWTITEPSGVALLADAGSGWNCVALAPSYAAFIALAAGKPVNWNVPAAAAAPNPQELLAAAIALLNGAPVSLVTVDMPIAKVPITTRRAADSAVSKAFGAACCAPALAANSRSQWHQFLRNVLPVSTIF